MANKRKQIKSTQIRPGLEERQETPAAETVTVVWMLCVLTGLICNVGAAITRYFVTEELPGLAMFSGLLYFAALAIGTLSVLLLPIVYRSRKIPPPMTLIVGSAVIAALPWAVLLVQMLRE